MSDRYEEIDLERIETVSIEERGSKVSVADFGDPVKGGKSFRKWLDSLPDQLAVKSLKELVLAMRRARSSGRGEIIWMIGAHVIKCGLSPYLIELMKKEYITALAMSGAGLIHDTEIAFFGETSEDVPRNLERGIFGFCRETADILFDAISGAGDSGAGLGESVGRHIIEREAHFADNSILAQAYRTGVPVTVHIAIGTDIIHQHPGFDAAAWGSLSARDFKILASRVRGIGENGGVVINAGSAVILPEVFLKAMSIARNLGASFDRITTCNLDMIMHYRPRENVLSRPTAFGGKSISLVGHHEIMIPLIFSSILS
jgi:hypothetical protein